MGKIVVTVNNHTGYILKKKTFRIRGIFRYQLLAAAKVLSLLSSIKDIFGEQATSAVIELVNIEDGSMFISLVKTYSPIPVKIIKKKEVIEHVS